MVFNPWRPLFFRRGWCFSPTTPINPRLKCRSIQFLLSQKPLPDDKCQDKRMTFPLPPTSI